MDDGQQDEPAGHGTHARPQPAFNAPAPVLLVIAVIALVHLVRTTWLDPREDTGLLTLFAVIPALYDAAWQGVPLSRLPAGGWSLVLAPFGHFFLHANWPHVAMNALWMLVFATPVARRMGGVRFLLLALASAAAGAMAFVLLHWGQDVLLVGASGGISGLMGASVRLIYAEGMPLFVGIRRDVRHVQPLTFAQALTLPGPRTFVLTWIALNLIIAAVGFGSGEGMDRIAGDAHIAGFFAGLALFPLFDRPARPGA